MNFMALLYFISEYKYKIYFNYLFVQKLSATH